jgi:hypothetical protein
MRLDRDTVVPLLLLAGLVYLLRRSGDGKPGGGAPSVGPCIPKVLTGRTLEGQPIDAEGWARSRYAAVLGTLTRRSHEAKDYVEVEDLPAIARALVAQWAHESGRGSHEYCFNLGGWHATKSEPCFASTDAGVPTRFRAWGDLDTSTNDHVSRLVNKFRRAVAALIEDPDSDRWVRVLREQGYYTAPVEQYAGGWRAQHAWLRSLGLGETSNA